MLSSGGGTVDTPQHPGFRQTPVSVPDHHFYRFCHGIKCPVGSPDHAVMVRPETTRAKDPGTCHRVLRRRTPAVAAGKQPSAGSANSLNPPLCHPASNAFVECLPRFRMTRLWLCCRAATHADPRGVANRNRVWAERACGPKSRTAPGNFPQFANQVETFSQSLGR